MKIKFPEKSLFGFKILNSKASFFGAYFFLIINWILIPKFGFKIEELIAGYLFVIISNISFLILLINSFLRKKTKKFFNVFTFPLVLYSPISIFFLIISTIELLKTILNKNFGLN